MKATLEFNLPEEEEEYQICSNARKIYGGIWDFKENLRRVIKHLPEDSELDENTLEKVQAMFWEEMGEVSHLF